MKSGRFFTLVAVFAVASQFQCGGSEEPVPPASRQVQAPVSPVVHDDRTVTFSLLAPAANSVGVTVSGLTGPVAMVRSGNGIWSATVGPLKPEIWEYSFVVDGVSMIDPGNAWLDQRLRPASSMMEVPGDSPMFYEIRDVPHGVVSVHTFASGELGEMRSFQVYTPPRYDRTKPDTYPVLYLLHGVSNDDRGWVVMGRANYILDNLIAEGKALPMIVVMPNGQYRRAGTSAPGFNAAGYEQDLFSIIIPTVEREYRVKTDPASRAIAGLSMGGRQALEIGMRNLDRYAWMGIFSPALTDTTYQSALAPYFDTANERLRLLWLAIGEDDGLLTRYEPFISYLDERGVRYTSTVSPGAHTWSVWRIYLRDLALLMFRTDS